jgi:hypothetical protein
MGTAAQFIYARVQAFLQFFVMPRDPDQVAAHRGGQLSGDDLLGEFIDTLDVNKPEDKTLLQAIWS